MIASFSSWRNFVKGIKCGSSSFNSDSSGRSNTTEINQYQHEKSLNVNSKTIPCWLKSSNTSDFTNQKPI